MDGFGQALRAHRLAAGMRQADLVTALDNVIARSTLANIEVGRERPSARLWQAIATNLPDWADDLAPWYAPRTTAPGFRLGDRVELLSTLCTYIFGSAHGPEELVQVRRVRATADRVDGYGLALSSSHGSIEAELESLWGGWVEEHEVADGDALPLPEGGSQVAARFHFDRVLRRGQVHEFGTRTWISRGQHKDWVCVCAAMPAAESVITLNFTGPRPRRVWSFGPSEGLQGPVDRAPAPAGPQAIVQPLPNGSCTVRVAGLASGTHHGMGWEW